MVQRKLKLVDKDIIKCDNKLRILWNHYHLSVRKLQFRLPQRPQLALQQRIRAMTLSLFKRVIVLMRVEIALINMSHQPLRTV